MTISSNSRAEPGSAPSKGAEPGFDYLDIPAFLRRQAD